jgi:hypothetical protein
MDAAADAIRYGLLHTPSATGAEQAIQQKIYNRNKTPPTRSSPTSRAT